MKKVSLPWSGITRSYIMKRKILQFLLLIFTATPCFSEINHPYYLYSENGKFFLKCIPHNGQGYEIEGRTDIYRSSDTSFLYSIQRYFNPDHIVLSNDGQSILYVGFSTINNHDAFEGNMILFFKNGILEQVYTIDQILSDDIQRWSFEFPKKLIEPTKFDIKYRVVLRKKQSDKDIIKEVRDKMKESH